MFHILYFHLLSSYGSSLCSALNARYYLVVLLSLLSCPQNFLGSSWLDFMPRRAEKSRDDWLLPATSGEGTGGNGVMLMHHVDDKPCSGRRHVFPSNRRVITFDPSIFIALQAHFPNNAINPAPRHIQTNAPSTCPIGPFLISWLNMNSCAISSTNPV